MSEPIPVAGAAGIIPSIATDDHHQHWPELGFSARIPPHRDRVVSGSVNRRLISETTSTPLITATPNSLTNPMAADTDRLMSRSQRTRIPPTNENGTFKITRPASRSVAKAKKSHAKTMRIPTVRMSVRRRAGAGQVLELPAPLHPVTVRQFHGRGDSGLRCRPRTRPDPAREYSSGRRSVVGSRGGPITLGPWTVSIWAVAVTEPRPPPA